MTEVTPWPAVITGAIAVLARGGLLIFVTFHRGSGLCPRCATVLPLGSRAHAGEPEHCPDHTHDIGHTAGMPHAPIPIGLKALAITGLAGIRHLATTARGGFAGIVLSTPLAMVDALAPRAPHTPERPRWWYPRCLRCEGGGRSPRTHAGDPRAC